MKILLDENIPHELRALFLPHHDVYTVSYLGWNGIENGRLLALAATHGFDALLTTDRGMEYEQNSERLACSVLVLIAPTNKAVDLRPLAPKVLRVLNSLKPKSFNPYFGGLCLSVSK